jgi:hypothetical protein
MNGTDASRKISAAAPDNKVHPENEAAFNRLDAGDQGAFLVLSEELQLSLHTEREFLEWLPEIAYSRKQTAAMVLESDEIRAARKSPVLNAPQKIEKIRAYIFSLRFPRYDAVLRQWKQLSQRTFGNIPGVVVTPSPYFEKNRLELRISIAKADEACEVMQKLAALPKNTWASLIDPMKY